MPSHYGKKKSKGKSSKPMMGGKKKAGSKRGKRAC